jgi:hypothetical protein
VRDAIGRVDLLSGEHRCTGPECQRFGGKPMVKSLLRFVGIAKDERAPEQFDPIYGLPRRSLDEWLSRNPALKKDYEAALLVRSQQSRSAHNNFF